MGSVLTYWSYLKHRVLKRRVPHAVLSWRYLLPGQSGYVRAHRKVFFSAWQRLPRLGWLAIAVYSYLLWFLYQGWRQAWLVWRKNSLCYAQQKQVSRIRQLRDLLSLVFLQTTPPAFYYRYRLSDYPKEQWLKFIYTHELPHWHLTFSPAISPQSERLMADKHLFASVMGNKGVPVVDGVLFESGNELRYDSVFQGRSLFIKPQRGSQKQGCMALQYDVVHDNYRLDTASVVVTEPADIFDYLQRTIDRSPYLVQPMLENHQQLLEAVPCSHLVTFRVVTFCNDGEPTVVSTLLEWQQETDSTVQFKAIYPLAFDVVTGDLSDYLRVIETQQPQPHSQPVRPTLLKSSLPIGAEIERITKAAHQVVPDIFAVGWDVVWTPTGLQLLEGNINWGVDLHQRQGPKLIEHYMNLVKGRHPS